MKELSQQQIFEISAGFKFHFNVIQTIFIAIGAGIMGGPVGAGIVIAGAIATQGAGNLHDMAMHEKLEGKWANR